ncbi:MAG TPA: hypothetical protein VFG68_14895 [Fimbriiglobus sp.]|nr:hypothetical protein [Fimbriiglobus sp.]
MTTPDPTPESNPLCGADPLARALAALRPGPAGVDTTRLLFEAGRVARDRELAFWRWVSIAQFALMATFGCVAAVVLVKLANTPPLVQVVYVEVPPKPEPAPPPRPAPDPDPGYAPASGFASAAPDPDALAEYLRVRQDVLTAGLGLLPDHQPRPTTAPASADELERSLNLPPGVLAVPQWQPRKPRTEPDVP